MLYLCFIYSFDMRLTRPEITMTRPKTTIQVIMTHPEITIQIIK